MILYYFPSAKTVSAFFYRGSVDQCMLVYVCANILLLLYLHVLD